MNRLASFIIIVLMVQLHALPAVAGGYQTLTPAYGDQGSGGAGMKFDPNTLNVSLDKALGQLQVQVPTDTVSFDQLQSVISQFPGVDKLNIQFPNQSQLLTSPSELLNLHSDFLQQAGSLGFGMNGMSVPQLVLSSLASQPGIAEGMGDAGAIAMLPITNMKSIMGDTFHTALQGLRYDQISLGDWMPDWLKSAWLSIYNFVMPYYYGAYNWVASFF